MKRIVISVVAAFVASTLLTGCLSIQLGGGSSTRQQSATVGQQLQDLQKARDAGAITEAEYQAQKMKILGR